MTADRGGVRQKLIDATLVLTIDAPARRNSLGAVVRDGLHAGLARAEADDSVRAVVVTAAGPVFSSGGDFVEDFGPVASGSRDDAAAMIDAYYSLFARVETCAVPVIAAVGGAAIGGGLELVMASDLAVASEDATFAPIEGRAVGTPSGWTLLRAADRLPHRVAAELVLTGEVVDASTALSWGVVNRVVPASDLLDHALAWGAAIARNSPHAVAASKAYLRERSRNGDPDAIRDLVVAAFATPESVAAIRGFSDRPRPGED